MAEILPYLANALLYGALAFYFWRTRWAPRRTPPPRRGADAGAIEHYAVLVPLALHAALLARAAVRRRTACTSASATRSRPSCG